MYCQKSTVNVFHSLVFIIALLGVYAFMLDLSPGNCLTHSQPGTGFSSTLDFPAGTMTTESNAAITPGLARPETNTTRTSHVEKCLVSCSLLEDYCQSRGSDTAYCSSQRETCTRSCNGSLIRYD